jgi:hypothetical protein
MVSSILASNFYFNQLYSEKSETFFSSQKFILNSEDLLLCSPFFFKAQLLLQGEGVVRLINFLICSYHF